MADGGRPGAAARREEGRRGGHDFAVWKADLYHFAPLLFR
jgi:hypothetical protein